MLADGVEEFKVSASEVESCLLMSPNRCDQRLNQQMNWDVLVIFEDLEKVVEIELSEINVADVFLHGEDKGLIENQSVVVSGQ